MSILQYQQNQDDNYSDDNDNAGIECYDAMKANDPSIDHRHVINHHDDANGTSVKFITRELSHAIAEKFIYLASILKRAHDLHPKSTQLKDKYYRVLLYLV